MAENKKAFVVYTDWKKYIDDLDDVQIGMWTRWMFEYCNDKWKDKDSQIEYPTDAAVKMLCLLTKDILKRDLKKYEDKKNRLLKNGKQYRTDINTKSVRNQNEIDTDIGTDIDTNIETVNSNKLLVNNNLDSNNINFSNKELESNNIKNNKSIVLKNENYTEDFERFWSMYPRKENKKNAFRIWTKLKVSNELLEKILKFIIYKIKYSEQWQDIKYIPMPTTFLNGKRWEDEVDFNKYSNEYEHSDNNGGFDTLDDYQFNKHVLN